MLMENLIWSCFNDAHGAVAYTSWQKGNSNYEPRLVTSKNCVASVKVVDIVRLSYPVR